MFTKPEIAYVHPQPLERIPTVSLSGRPAVVLVRFEFDNRDFYTGGTPAHRTRKHKNIQHGNAPVVLVADDLVSVKSLDPRGIRIHDGREMVEPAGMLVQRCISVSSVRLLGVGIMSQLRQGALR